MNIRTITALAASLGAIALLSGCSKWDEKLTLSQPVVKVSNPVSDSAALCGPIKGTMLSGKTYTINCSVIVPAGDTLFLQEDVRVNVAKDAQIVVRGALISLGTKDKPNWITVPGLVKTDNSGVKPTEDVAYSGKWGGIVCDTSCALFCVKWTHIEYTGSNITTSQVAGQAAGTPSNAIFYQNPAGVFILEDSWIYGVVDDAVRINSGKIAVMRNSFEKIGLTSGEAVNTKSGCIGDIAYNLFVGVATNGAKLSNSGATAQQANINTYNNTFVNCGFRQIQSGRGGSINYEKQVKGKVYNNLIVNCKYGFRIVNSADTANMAYGSQYTYADSLVVANQIYPVGYVTVPQSSDIPGPGVLPAGYVRGAAYDGAAIVGKNNPLFKGFALPNYNYLNTTAVAASDFHLSAGSPAIGKGNSTFSALRVVPAEGQYGATDITPPGIDIGAFQSDGKGNQH